MMMTTLLKAFVANAKNKERLITKLVTKFEGTGVASKRSTVYATFVLKLQ